MSIRYIYYTLQKEYLYFCLILFADLISITLHQLVQQFFLPFISSFSLFLSSLQKPGMDVADGYVTFVRHSQDMLREKVNEEVYIERLFDVSKPQQLLLKDK